jgi:hypothetical protein
MIYSLAAVITNNILWIDQNDVIFWALVHPFFLLIIQYRLSAYALPLYVFAYRPGCQTVCHMICIYNTLTMYPWTNLCSPLSYLKYYTILLVINISRKTSVIDWLSRYIIYTTIRNLF